MNNFKKQELITKIAGCLDITPDMYNQAISVINGLKMYLNNIDPKLSIYKQGSFRLGTIIKPYNKDKDGDYDIDLVICFPYEKKSVNPMEIKQQLGQYLHKSPYKNHLEKEHGRCWTLNYDDKENCFHIDLLPCIKEDQVTMLKIKPNDLAKDAIAITDKIDNDSKIFYEWETSNPNGYAKWFDSVNKNKYKQYIYNDRKRLFDAFPKLFESVDKVSDEFTRTPLQQVIQILKRHRDVTFAQQDNKMKPASIIVTTLVTKIVEENEININNTYQLLKDVVDGLKFYANLDNSKITSEFADEFKNKKLITKINREGKPYWEILNPANSEENLANRWNEDNNCATNFFKWVNQVSIDLIDILDNEPSLIIVKLKQCLGINVAQRLLEVFNFDVPAPATRNFIANEKTPKPYRIN